MAGDSDSRSAESLWRHSALSTGDKLFNLGLRFFFPLRNVPEKPEALGKMRAFMERIGADSFRKLSCTTVRTARGDGTDLEILMITHPAHDPAKPAPLVLFFHGGGFTVGKAKDAALESWLITPLSQKHGANAVYASVEYRLAPEHASPAAFDDGERAFSFLTSSANLAQAHGYDLSKGVHIWGVSAGANLALSVAASVCRRGERDKLASVFADCPMMNPPCDMPSFSRNASSSMICPVKWLRWSWEVYLNAKTPEELGAALNDPRTCPHTAPGGFDGMSGLQVLLITALGDPLCDDGLQVRDALTKAGAALTHVEMQASHCVGWMFDSTTAKCAWARLATMLT
ncbi:hypothetical protein AB1Y20_015470 [Prymnesium parvum]|uniref:Alpha/beta hydrolase fold-3 domain-containing protein n=1 Tax=Prymnesium parvum TaxID=97485 RepID=A0AB34JYH2_PRYPA